MHKKLLSNQFRFMIVDDEPDLREIIILIIASYLKADFLEANSGKEAIKLLESEKSKIDLIISDFNMPNGNGGTLAKFITEKGLNIPFLLLSSDERHKHEDLLSAPGRSYLQKPFQNNELRAIMEFLLQKIDGVQLSEQDYVPVSLSTLQRVTAITRPLYLQLTDKKYIKVVNPGGYFTFEEVERFTNKNITHLYVFKDDMGPLLNEFRENVFTEMYFHSLKERSTEALKLSKSTVELIQIAAKSLNWSPEIVAMGNDNVKMIQNIVMTSPDINNVFDWFSTEVHSLGVSTGILLSYFLAALTKEMGLTNYRQLECLTMSGFFHDMMLDDYLIRNQDQFIKTMMLGAVSNKDQVEKIKNHPMAAKEILIKWSHCPKDLMALVEQHHELPDGSGFPYGLKGDQLHPLSGILIVACCAMEVFIRTKDKKAVREHLHNQSDLFLQTPTADAYRAALKLF